MLCSASSRAVLPVCVARAATRPVAEPRHLDLARAERRGPSHARLGTPSVHGLGRHGVAGGARPRRRRRQHGTHGAALQPGGGVARGGRGVLPGRRLSRCRGHRRLARSGAGCRSDLVASYPGTRRGVGGGWCDRRGRYDADHHVGSQVLSSVPRGRSG